jgi:transposase
MSGAGHCITNRGKGKLTMATANANQIITLTVSEAMRLGAATRALPLSTYLLQLADSDAAEIRSLRTSPPLGSTSRCEVSREEIRSSNADWSHRMPEGQRKKILELLAEGLSPRTVAQRCQTSDATVYRARSETRKTAQSHRSRRHERQSLADSDIAKMCAAYATGATVAALATQFQRSQAGVYYVLRKRGVRRGNHYPVRKPRKAQHAT